MKTIRTISGREIIPNSKEITRPDKEQLAQLIAEAGTVYNETGMTPREMQKEIARLNKERSMSSLRNEALEQQNKELLEALKACRERLAYDDGRHPSLQEGDRFPLELAAKAIKNQNNHETTSNSRLYKRGKRIK